MNGWLSPEAHLRAAGVAQILLAVAHPLMASRLGWKRESARMSSLTAQVFWVHTYFLMLTLLLFGLLSLVLPRELLTSSPLARAVLLGLTLFWGARLYAQHFIYSSEHWRGHRLNTTIHALFTLLWVYLTLVYAGALLLLAPRH
jgi:hypothetical protein